MNNDSIFFPNVDINYCHEPHLRKRSTDSTASSNDASILTPKSLPNSYQYSRSKYQYKHRKSLAALQFNMIKPSVTLNDEEDEKLESMSTISSKYKRSKYRKKIRRSTWVEGDDLMNKFLNKNKKEINSFHVDVDGLF
eukprot:344937_1